MIQTFYNTWSGENIILNNPYSHLSKDVEFWYQLVPALEFGALDYLYSTVPNMDSIMQTVADKWYNAIVVMGGYNLNFDHLTYDFIANNYVNGGYSEPDAAAGAGLFEYWAFKKWGTQKYLDAAKWCMQYLQSLNINPTYEALSYFAPYLGARLNAEQGQINDISKMMKWVFNSTSDRRSGWGCTTGSWGRL